MVSKRAAILPWFVTQNFQILGWEGEGGIGGGSEREIEGDREIKTFTFVAIFRIWAIGIIIYTKRWQKVD